MTPKPFHDNHFDSIQALRGIAAVFIALEHIRFLNCGAFGVDIFFALSGFMIMFTTHKGKEAFFRKRLIRILPLYYLMTIGTFLLLLLFPSMFEQTEAKPVFLIKSLLFIPFDIGDGVIQPLMRIGWTVNCEMFFYLLFFLSMQISMRYRGFICSGLIGIFVLLAELLSINNVFLTFYGAPVMLEFILGMVCYAAARFLYEHCYRRLSSCTVHFAAFIAAVGIFVILLLTKPAINILGFRRPLIWGIPGMFLVLCFFIMGIPVKPVKPSEHTPLSKKVCRRVYKYFVQLGNISFSLYLIHYYPVMLLDRAVFHFTSCTPFTVLGVFISLAVSILAASISWYIMEQKLTGWMKKHLL